MRWHRWWHSTGFSNMNKVSMAQRNLNSREVRKRAAQAVKRRLVLLAAFLLVSLFFLLLRIGERSWPFWLSIHRTQIEGLIGLASVLLTVLAPVITEVITNPRTLSGPGKWPGDPPID
jgi:hypothetical protein